jgi:protein gp37
VPRLIGLAGLAGSGKSTAAEALVREFGAARIPFAEALRRIVDGAGVCPPEAIRDAKDGKHFGTFEWSLTDTAYAFGAAGVSRHSRGKHHVAREFPTGRALLQWVGTDLLRTADPDVWIKLHADAVARSAAQIGARIVVADDCRFPNERQYIRDAGGLLIRLRRTDQEAAASSHPSENSLGEDAEYDEVIELPFGSVEELQATVVNVVRREWPSVLGQDDTTVAEILGWADDYAANHTTVSREILQKHVRELVVRATVAEADNEQVRCALGRAAAEPQALAEFVLAGEDWSETHEGYIPDLICGALGKFMQAHGGANFVTMTALGENRPDGSGREGYEVTVSRVGAALTPAQRIEELEAANAQLIAEATEFAQDVLGGYTPFTTTFEAAAKWLARHAPDVLLDLAREATSAGYRGCMFAAYRAVHGGCPDGADNIGSEIAEAPGGAASSAPTEPPEASTHDTHGGTVAPDGTTECICVPGIREVLVVCAAAPDGTPVFERGCEHCQGSGAVIGNAGAEFQDLVEEPCEKCDATGSLPAEANQGCDFTWNPVTGCKHRCTFGPAKTPCYAATKSKHFGLSFEPAFHEERLGAPSKLAAGEARPWRIFVCSMADLFGHWVPGEWIEAVIQVARECPEHVFQFLTKSPLRYREFEWPQNCWLGATVTGSPGEPWVSRLVALTDPDLSCAIRWASVEPLCGELVEPENWNWFGTFCDKWRGGVQGPFTRAIRPLQWAVIGGMTGEGSVQPDEAWVDAIESDCAAHGVPVYHKQNLACRRGDRRRTEWPGVGL